MTGERRAEGPARALRAVGTPPRQEAALPHIPSREYHNLPRRLTRFIGREAQVTEILNLVSSVRILTLTGAGGCGKSRLALEVGSRATDDFAEGVCWVDVAPLEAPSLVADAMASALSVPESMFLTRIQGLERFLRDRSNLILLDNCEHLISSCAELATNILEACPGIRILATSREPFGIEGETVWPVPPLDLPSEEDSRSANAAAASEAVQLFVDRAIGQRPSFGLTDANAAVVAEICRRLDGIPLGIELAAARVRVLSPEQIAEGLEDRLTLLAKGTRTGVTHHRTLEASMDWSYELLSDAARQMLRRLSVFAGSFTLEAAERVTAGEGIDRSAVLDLLSELVDKSLVNVEAHGETSRYRLLETVRQYARRKLADSGQESTVRDRHLAFFVDFAERAEPELEGHGYAEWVGSIGHELANLRSAMDWAAAPERADRGLRIAAALWGFWRLRGHLREARDRLAAFLNTPGLEESFRGKGFLAAARMAGWLADVTSGSSFAHQALEIGRRTGDGRTIGRSLTILAFIEGFADTGRAAPIDEEAAEVARKADDPVALAEALAHLGFGETARGGNLGKARALLEEAVSVARGAGYVAELSRALCWLGWTALYQGSFGEAEKFLSECLDLGRMDGDPTGFHARAYLGLAASWRGEHGRARELLGEAETLAAESGNPFMTAWIHMVSARSEAAGGDLAAADSSADAAINFFRPMGFKALLAWCVAVKGEVAAARGDNAAARACWEEALALARETRTGLAVIRSLQGQARLARVAGELHEALALQHEALHLMVESEHFVFVADALEELGGILSAGQDFREAARLFGAAQGLRERIGYVRPQLQRDGYQADLSHVHEALGSDEFSAIWNQGLAMGAEEAVAYAARGRGRRLRPAAGWASLTPTELDVVRLVAEGRTNPEIAERLFLARSTVKTHLLHVFAKLGVSNRAELAALVARRTK